MEVERLIKNEERLSLSVLRLSEKEETRRPGDRVWNPVGVASSTHAGVGWRGQAQTDAHQLNRSEIDQES